LQLITDLPYETRIVEQWIPLADGTRLWMKAWMPVTEHPVPAILEYLPYRSGDWTAPRDHERHPYYAGHGYASIRVDIRGHGNSDGVPGDEYDAQELGDGCEVIDWIAAQDWCTGKVGMFGISWGGFNSLQLASMRPEPLKAIVTTCSADDRYDNDVHYFGGSMLGVDMLAWAATMLAFESRPPDPRAVGDRWKDQWLDRLGKMDPYLDEWVRHQLRDDFWKHGSVCEDYSRIDAAVMTVGGWYDPYRDTVLRLVQNLSALGKDVKGLLGPWAHQYPDRDLRPGPHIDFLGETLRWWDHWLKDEDTGVMDEPLLRTWITDPIPPSSVYEQMPGRWIAEQSWPSPSVTPTSVPLADAQVSPLAATLAESHGAGHVAFVRSPQDTGQNAGRYFPYGNAADLPVDQRAEDGRSVSFDLPLTQDVEILGNARARLRVNSPTERGQVYVRLCDVAPDGSSTLITRGNLNLSAREGRDRMVPMPAGEWVEVEVPMTGIGYHFPAGHVLRVAVSTAYWPWVWPQADAQGLSLDLDHSEMVLPVRAVPADGSEQAALDASVSFGPPVQPVGLDVTYPEAGQAGVTRPERLVSSDVVAGTTELQVDPAYGGTRVYPDGLHYDEDTVERYWIDADDPTTARTEAVWKVGISRPDQDWQTSLEATTRLSCDTENFFTESILDCWDHQDRVFHKEWRNTIPRQAS
jgi:putative CocE/NonD family hydrolase